jgi:hypothetical protein
MNVISAFVSEAQRAGRWIPSTASGTQWEDTVYDQLLTLPDTEFASMVTACFPAFRKVRKQNFAIQKPLSVCDFVTEAWHTKMTLPVPLMFIFSK